MQLQRAGAGIDAGDREHVIANEIALRPAVGAEQHAFMCRDPEADGAIELVHNHPYANGVALFTNDGGAARKFQHEVHVGMVGINVPIPVPVAYHTFGGWKRSAFGDTNQHGMEGVKFWTKVKTVTQRWPDDGGPVAAGNAFIIPTMG